MTSEPLSGRYHTKEHTQDILEIGETRSADDGSGHSRLREDPRKRDLRHAHAFLLRQLINPEVYGSMVRTPLRM